MNYQLCLDISGPHSEHISLLMNIWESFCADTSLHGYQYLGRWAIIYITKEVKKQKQSDIDFIAFIRLFESNGTFFYYFKKFRLIEMYVNVSS